MVQAEKALALIQTAQANGFVSTPGGFRQRSHVHLVQSGESVIKRAGISFVMDLATGQLKDSSETGVAARNPADETGGWVTWASWRNATGTAISSFATTWIVPGEPASPAAQLIYIFNRLQNLGGTEILQPVFNGEVQALVGGVSGVLRTGTSTRRDTRTAHPRHQ